MGTPDPLTPPDCDLRGLPFMPMDTIRVIDSDLFATSTGEEFKAAFALWCKAWQQVPAGSLPDDDRVLAHLSGANSRWKKIKSVALRNWVKCSDGRLYHPVVAEKAMEALPSRLEYRERKSGEADRKARERSDRKDMFEQLRSVGVVPEYNTKTSDLRALVTKYVTRDVTDNVTHVTEEVTPVTDAVTAKTGTGTGTVKKEEESSDAAKNRGHRLPTDFEMPEDWLTWATNERHWSPRDTNSEAASFIDFWHAKSGKDATKLDWEATWRNWVRNSRRLTSVEMKPGGDNPLLPDFA